MSNNTIFYAKQSRLRNTNQQYNVFEIFEWWVLNDRHIIIQNRLEGKYDSPGETYCYEYEMEEADYIALTAIIGDAFSHICPNEKNIVSWWEMQAYDPSGNIKNWFEGSNVAKQTVQNIIYILLKYMPFEEAERLIASINTFNNSKRNVEGKTNVRSRCAPKETSAHYTESKLLRILRIFCNILTIGLLLVGGVSYGKDLVWRLYSYDDSLTQYSGIIFFLTLSLPVFYLLFFNSKSKYKNYLGLIAAGLVLIRQVFCLIRELNVSSFACLIAAGSFFLIFLFTLFIHNQRHYPYIILSSIVPIIFSIVGIIEMDTGITHNYVSLSVISPIFTVFCHYYLIVNTSTAE